MFTLKIIVKKERIPSSNLNSSAIYGAQIWKETTFACMIKEIIFFNRAYNDTDIQISLMNAFAQDKNFLVRVIGIPCDGYLGNPDDHEAASYLKTYQNVLFENILENSLTPLHLRILRKCEKTFRSLKKDLNVRSPTAEIFFRYMHVLFLRLIAACLKFSFIWLDKIADTYDADIVVIDEIACQPHRSPVVDRVLPILKQKGSRIFIVQTGQYIYKKPFVSSSPVCYRKSQAIMALLPAKLDSNHYSGQFPQEDYKILGNARMDTNWIKQLSQNILVEPFYPRQFMLSQLPQGKVKVALMLSKLSYGVEEDHIKSTIAALGGHKNVALAIKPHTRGMKFDFMLREDIGRAVDVSDVPSSLLIDWADIVLVTGSSIVFHALQKGKHAGLLKYCQRLETAFDDGACCHVFQSQEELMVLIERIAAGDHAVSAARQKEINDWLRDNVHGGDPQGLSVERYKSEMLSYMGAAA